MNKRNAILYCCVACNDRIALEMQEKRLKNYADQNGYTVIGVLSECTSGLTMDRSALRPANQLIIDGKADTIIVTNLSRVSRDMLQCNDYINFLHEHHAKLICVKENIIFIKIEKWMFL